MVPVLGRVHAGPAGDPDVFDEETREAEILATYFERDPEVHVLDYEGDCMNRVFGEGTTSLVVSPNSPFGNGRHRGGRHRRAPSTWCAGWSRRPGSCG